MGDMGRTTEPEPESDTGRTTEPETGRTTGSDTRKTTEPEAGRSTGSDTGRIAKPDTERTAQSGHLTGCPKTVPSKLCAGVKVRDEENHRALLQNTAVFRKDTGFSVASLGLKEHSGSSFS
jgi:hypothetical protein